MAVQKKGRLATLDRGLAAARTLRRTRRAAVGGTGYLAAQAGRRCTARKRDEVPRPLRAHARCHPDYRSVHGELYLGKRRNGKTVRTEGRDGVPGPPALGLLSRAAARRPCLGRETAGNDRDGRANRRA